MCLATTQHQPSAHPPPASALPPQATSPASYVPLPRRLLEDLRDAPVAIGVYALLGRLYQTRGEAAPLSPADLQAYDPALSYGAARRAFGRLVDAGYAIAEGTEARKRTYRPTWGRINDAPRPWDRRFTSQGRPRHISVVRLDDRLLDLCLGRLRPSGSHRAIVERYLAAPLLGLREVGVYALALAGLQSTSAALTGLGLLGADGRALPLPNDRTVLAIASQRAAGNAAHGALTEAGWRYVGIAPAPPATPVAEPLFFVPADVIGGGIGHVIGHVIGGPAEGHTQESAPVCAELPVTPDAPGSHGVTESDREHRSSTTRPSDRDDASTGGGIHKNTYSIRPGREGMPLHPSQKGSHTRPTSPTAPPRLTRPAADTATASPGAAEGAASPTAPVSDTGSDVTCLLRGVGVRADVAAGLAGSPAEQVARIIAQGRARRDVRDLAGWVVSALRALPAPEELAPPPPKVSETAILFHPRLSGYDRQRWLMRFRKATPADRPAILARFHAEHPLEDTDVAAA